MRNKKVAFFVSSFFDGIGVNTVRLAKAFYHEGYDVDLLVTKAEATKANYIGITPSTVRIIEFKRNSVYKALPQLIKYMKSERPNVIISGGEAPNLTLILAKLLTFNKLKTKIIVSIRTHLTTQYKHRRNNVNAQVLKVLGKILYRFSDEIVAVSRGVAEDVAKLFNINQDEITIIYNPIVDKHIYECCNEEVFHPWINDDKTYLILGVGRLAPQKNFSLLIKSIGILRETINAKLIIIGDGSEKEALEKEIFDLKLEEHVDLIGYRSNPYPFMKNADAFVLSSDWEGFGNVIVEAMACGARVVSTDCPSGPSEILDNGKYGILVKRNDPELMSKAIMQSLKQEFNPKVNIQRANYFSVEKSKIEYKKIIEHK